MRWLARLLASRRERNHWERLASCSDFPDDAGSRERVCSAASSDGQSDRSNSDTWRKVGAWSSWARLPEALLAESGGNVSQGARKSKSSKCSRQLRTRAWLHHVNSSPAPDRKSTRLNSSH